MLGPIRYRFTAKDRAEEQYVGRPNRDYDGKENVIAYDYADNHILKSDKMYAARLKTYKKAGYRLEGKPNHNCARQASGVGS